MSKRWKETQDGPILQDDFEVKEVTGKTTEDEGQDFEDIRLIKSVKDMLRKFKDMFRKSFGNLLITVLGGLLVIFMGKVTGCF